jgi:hypothetical protein
MMTSAVVAHVLRLSGLHVDLDELIARDVGETNELTPIVCGAEEEFAAVGLEEEEVRVASRDLLGGLALRTRRVLADSDAQVCELVGDFDAAVALVGWYHCAEMNGVCVIYRKYRRLED